MVVSRGGIVAAESPLAAQAGATILAHGGNAIDAAVATNAVMGVVEPMMNGIGGDLFAIVYDAKTGKLYGLNASGWAPAELSIEFLKSKGIDEMPQVGIHSVTVPGAVDGWSKLLSTFRHEAIPRASCAGDSLRSRGVSCSRVGCGLLGRAKKPFLKKDKNFAATYLIDGRAPRVGDVFRNPDLARSLETDRRGRPRCVLQGRDRRRASSLSRRKSAAR